MVWGLRLALTHRRNDLFLMLGSLEGDRADSTCCLHSPPAFPQHLSAGEKQAALKRKMLGGTTNGKPGSLGHGDMGIGRTVGVPQRIV